MAQLNKKYFAIDLDAIFDDLWHEFERLQDGTSGHKIAFAADDKKEAAKTMSSSIIPFLKSFMYESDKTGCPIEN